MLSKKNRLPPEEFKVRDRKTLSTPYFLVKFASNRAGHNRFGFIISTGAVKRSVDRHHWKRRLSEYVEKWRSVGYDFLIIVSPRIQGAEERSVKNETEKVFDAVSRAQQTAIRRQ